MGGETSATTERARERAEEAHERERDDRARARDGGEDAPAAVDDVSARGEGEDEGEECGFCKYMKGGSCRDAFVAWEACVDAAKGRGEDFVDACFETTSALRDCMLRDPEYYGPMTGSEEGEDGEGDDVGEAGDGVGGAKESAA